jgi:multiple sugar transport system permease protein
MSTGTVAAPARARRERKVQTDRAKAERRLAYGLVAPAIIVMAFVTAYPIVDAIALSLQRADLRFPAQNKWVGLDNYGHVLSSSVWWSDVWHTIFFVVVSVAIELVLGMLLALAMHRVPFVRGAVRSIGLIPYGIITVVAAFSWRYAWEADSGWIPGLLGLHSDPLAGTTGSWVAIIISDVWKSTPFMALLLLGGLALVPDELQEAARVDGASTWQRFWRITIPLMKSAIMVALLFRVLDAMRIFDIIYIMNFGAHNTESVSVLDYNTLLNRLNLGLGSAVSVLIFLMIAVVAFVFIKGFGTAALPGGDES